MRRYRLEFSVTRVLVLMCGLLAVVPPGAALAGASRQEAVNPSAREFLDRLAADENVFETSFAYVGRGIVHVVFDGRDTWLIMQFYDTLEARDGARASLPMHSLGVVIEARAGTILRPSPGLLTLDFAPVEPDAEYRECGEGLYRAEGRLEVSYDQPSGALSVAVTDEATGDVLVFDAVLADDGGGRSAPALERVRGPDQSSGDEECLCRADCPRGSCCLRSCPPSRPIPVCWCDVLGIPHCECFRRAPVDPVAPSDQ